MIRRSLIDSIIPSPDMVFDIILRAENHKKLVWTAGRVLKEAALWKRVDELDHEERRRVLTQVTRFLKNLASQGVLKRRAQVQSIGYGDEIGFDYVHPREREAG